MANDFSKGYMRGFLPYALAAFLIGLAGGFSSVLGPAFVADLGIAYSNTTWTALAQAMATAACAPILGKLGDIIGRRTTLLLGLAAYTLGNLLTALADSLLFMLLARFIVGVGTAAVSPVVLAYIVAEFPPSAAAKGFSLYMLISSASVIFGPTLGSLLIAARGWRAMVWVCVALSAGVLLACLALSRGERRSVPGKAVNFDGVGAVWVILFFSLTLCIPTFGQTFGWVSLPFIVLLLAALAALTGLVMAEKRAENPILNGDFMRRRVFILSVLALFLTQGLMQANMTDVIVFVNYTQPENTAISGYAISIMYLGMSLGSVFLGPLADRWPARGVLTGSMLLTGVGCGLMLAFSEDTPLSLLALSLGLLGVGLGGGGTILMKTALSGVPAEQAGAGTGIYGLFRDLAAPFGVAVLVPMFTNQITALTEGGAASPLAAVRAARTLSVVELGCVLVGIVVVWMLPEAHPRKQEGGAL